jgi:prophage regulatory protein
MSAKSHRLIRLKEVLQLVPLSRSTIYARMHAGTFPQSRDLGGGVVAWYESQVLEWIEALPGAGSENNLGVGEGVADEEAIPKAA